MFFYRLFLGFICCASLTGCAIHRRHYTAAQNLLLHTPKLQSQAPTARPQDVQ